MKRFTFGLEKILELRKYYEQEAQVELGRAIGVLTKIEDNIKQNAVMRGHAANERFARIGATKGVGAGGGDAFGGAISMFDWDNYILRLEQEAQRLAEEAVKAEAVVEEKRGVYIEASRELKVIEKLREKRQKEHREEVLAAESSERDDAWRAKSAEA